MSEKLVAEIPEGTTTLRSKSIYISHDFGPEIVWHALEMDSILGANGRPRDLYRRHGLTASSNAVFFVWGYVEVSTTATFDPISIYWIILQSLLSTTCQDIYLLFCEKGVQTILIHMYTQKKMFWGNLHRNQDASLIALWSRWHHAPSCQTGADNIKLLMFCCRFMIEILYQRRPSKSGVYMSNEKTWSLHEQCGDYNKPL